VNNTNLHPISHRFQVIADYWLYFRFRQGVTLFNTLVQGKPPKLTTKKFGINKLWTSIYRVVCKLFRYL